MVQLYVVSLAIILYREHITKMLINRGIDVSVDNMLQSIFFHSKVTFSTIASINMLTLTININYLTFLFFLMDFPMLVDKVSIELSIS